MSSWGFMAIAVVAAMSMLVLFNWRRAITVTRIKSVKAPLDKVWQAIDLTSDAPKWHPDLDKVEVQEDGRKVLTHHSMHRQDGSAVRWRMQFEVLDRKVRELLRLKRCGLDDSSTTNDRMLEVSIKLEPCDEGARVTWSESWDRGP